MLSLHEALYRLSTMNYWDKKIPDFISNRILSGKENLTWQDENGDTLLHTAFKLKLIPQAIQLIEAGADPTIRNHEKKTPIEIFIEKDKPFTTFSGKNGLHLFSCLQKCHPDVLSIITCLEALPFDGDYGTENGWPKYLCDVIDENLYPLETLHAVLQWSKQRYDVVVKSPGPTDWVFGPTWAFIGLIKRMEGQINLLEKAFDLPFAIAPIIDATEKNKNTIFRAFLLGNPPLGKVLNMLRKDDIFLYLRKEQRDAFDNFCQEYEHKKAILEELSAQPSELNDEEKALINPIFQKLDNVLFNLMKSKWEQGWEKRMNERERSSALKHMQVIYEDSKAKNEGVRKELLSEIINYKTQISNGKYLGKNGFLSKQKRRDKNAMITENSAAIENKINSI